MEVDEAFRRLRAHAILIVVAVVAGLSVPAALHAGRRATYKATARIALDVIDPGDAGGSDAVADGALGIVSSPGRVGQALRLVGASRDPQVFARDNIRLRSIGKSALVELIVFDGEPGVAAGVANLLADELVDTRRTLAEGRLSELLIDLDTRIEEASALVTTLEAGLQFALGQRGVSPAVERYREAVRARDDLTSERRKMLEDAARRPQATVIDRAEFPTDPEPSGLVSDIELGAILGLILGLGLVAVRETVQPTVAGPRSLSRLLGAPSLGTLPPRRKAPDTDGIAALAVRARLAADAARVRTIALTTAGRDPELKEFPALLKAAIGGEVAGLRSIHEVQRPSWQVVLAEEDRLQELRELPSSVGLVLVAPTVLKRRGLDGVLDLRSVTGWQLIGIVTYRRRWLGARWLRALWDKIDGALEPYASIPPSPQERGGEGDADVIETASLEDEQGTFTWPTTEPVEDRPRTNAGMPREIVLDAVPPDLAREGAALSQESRTDDPSAIVDYATIWQTSSSEARRAWLEWAGWPPDADPDPRESPEGRSDADEGTDRESMSVRVGDQGQRPVPNADGGPDGSRTVASEGRQVKPPFDLSSRSSDQQ